MQTSLVLTVIGPDRPGIVEQLSDQVLAVGGNWEESRMTRLAGKFAGLLRVSVDIALMRMRGRSRGTAGYSTPLTKMPSSNNRPITVCRLIEGGT